MSAGHDVRRARALVLLLSIHFASACACAEGVSLAPAAAQPAGNKLRLAAASVRNDSRQVVQAVRFHWQGGGPAVVAPAVIPPGAATTFDMPLPAISEQQVYDVELLAAARPDSPVVGRSTATIHWPLALVNADRWVNWRYQQAVPSAADWPAAFKRQVIVAAAVLALAMMGALLIRRVGLRLAVLAIVMLGGTAAMAGLLWHGGPERVIVQPVKGQGTSLVLAVSARRTTNWTSDRPLTPVYVSADQMQHDDSVIEAGGGIRANISPAAGRLFEEAR